MARLFLMMGIPGSGKSTFIQNHLETDSQIWVSRDKIRFSLVKENEPFFSKETLVYNTFVDKIINGLQFDYDVYADATHLSKASRNKLISRIPKDLYDELNLIWIKVDTSVAVARNELRAGTRAYIEPKAIRKLSYGVSNPSYEEGFDNIYIVNINNDITLMK